MAAWSRSHKINIKMFHILISSLRVFRGSHKRVIRVVIIGYMGEGLFRGCGLINEECYKNIMHPKQNGIIVTKFLFNLKT